MLIHSEIGDSLQKDKHISKSSQSKFRIGFIIAYESSPYAGAVRPFINWAKELKKQHMEADIILYRAGNKILHYLDKIKLNYHSVYNISELRKVLRDNAYVYTVIDDYIKRLELVNELTRYSKLIIYSQVLYGLHAVVPVFNPLALPLRYRIIYVIAKITPFSILRRRYYRAISKAHLIIANSETTKTLLYSLYGIIAHNVVYPPVDTNIFKPLNKSKKNQVILYVGSHGGDTDPRLVEKICITLGEKEVDVVMLGNAGLASALKARKCRAEYISGISDEELAKLYSSSIATITPQLWEQFGYVVAESIACGTPVIAFNVMGPAEIIGKTGAGILVNNYIELLNVIRHMEKHLNSTIFKNIFTKKSKNIYLNSWEFDISVSTSRFLKTIDTLSLDEIS